jgi:two-component system response regulator YesN
MKEAKLKNLVKNMLYNLLESIDGSQDELDEMRYRYFDLIDQSHYSEDLIDSFGFIREDIMNYIQAKSYSEDTRINKILDYISSHYAESLDLAGLAKVFNFNYYYLSAYFSQHMVEGFSGYLNRIRIDQACRLLEEEDYTIAQISNMVGYSEQSYFSRVFKKMTGMTPSKWRKNYQQRHV